MIYGSTDSIHANSLYLTDDNSQNVRLMSDSQDQFASQLYIPSFKKIGGHTSSTTSHIVETKLNVRLVIDFR